MYHGHEDGYASGFYCVPSNLLVSSKRTRVHLYRVVFDPRERIEANLYFVIFTAMGKRGCRDVPIIINYIVAMP